MSIQMDKITTAYPLEPLAALPASRQAKDSVQLPRPSPCNLKVSSDFRRVFQTSHQMREEFAKFLKTIFYQLDEKKVFALMEQLLLDPAKSDEEIYKELMAKIQTTKKRFSFLSKLRSLFVLKRGMGQQVAQLMKGFDKAQFHDYMEIYDRRYLKTIQKMAKLPLDGKRIAVCNNSDVGVSDRIQAGALLSSYPYKQHEPLNDADCKDPFLHPEKTHKPISENIADNSVDIIACLGGLHHIPADRIDAFVGSMHSKLRPGGVILLREHDVADHIGAAKLPKDDIRALASVVHTFVNASDGVSWEVESREVREFKSVQEWTHLMERHGFKRISNEQLVLKDDPTENAMCAFVKKPTSLEEMQRAAAYIEEGKRPKEGTRATWIEWGNVRFSKQYADYIQGHHAYAFDSIGHLRQHWKHFFYFFKESLKDKDVPLKNLLFSDNAAMNLFILAATTLQCGISASMSLPSRLIARWKHGKNWRSVCHLTELEKFQARYEKDYSNFIDHTPFYQYDYLGKIKELWKTIGKSSETGLTRIANRFNGVLSSLDFLAKAAVCAPIRHFYTTDAHVEPDKVMVLLKDPLHELSGVVDRWERAKDAEHDKGKNIEVIYETPNGYKLVSMPRYRPFTQILGYLPDTEQLDILEIGCQKEVSVDVCLQENQSTPQVDGAHVVYEMERLQDEQKRRYVTYQVNINALKRFQHSFEQLEYIHE